MILTMLPNGRGRFEEDGLSFEGKLSITVSGTDFYIVNWDLELDDPEGMTTISGKAYMKCINHEHVGCKLIITGEPIARGH